MTALAAPTKRRRVVVPLELPPPRPLSARRGVQSLSGKTMGTTWSVRLIAPFAAGDLRRPIEETLARIVAQMSPWEPASDVSRFNAAPAGTWHTLKPEFATVLGCALQLAEQTGGAYDPTIGPLVNLWGFGPEARPGSLPTEAQIAAARGRCGWQRICFEADGARILQPGGIALDLSSVAKGYAVDCVARLLKDADVTSFLVEIGGELRGEGVKLDGLPWWVSIEPPPGDASDQVTIVALCGLSVATSGAYQRYFAVDGRSYSHTIDPRSGGPVAHELVSVTVLHPECMWADALATVLTVLGPEDGMTFARQTDIAAMLVTADAAGIKERLSPRLAAMLS